MVAGDAVFLIKIDGRKDFVFRNDKFPGFEHPHNLFDYFQNKAADSFSYWIFSSLQQEKKSTIMWNAWVLWVFVFSHYPILFWKLKIIGSSTIPTSFKLVLFFSIRNDFHCHKQLHHRWSEGRDPPMVCLFSVQNITKKIKTQRSRHLHVQS